MPITALIEGKILCMHGGLGPDLEKILQIKGIKKPCEIPDSGILCDVIFYGLTPLIKTVKKTKLHLIKGVYHIHSLLM